MRVWCAPQPKIIAGTPGEVRQQSVSPVTPGHDVSGTHGLIAICPHCPSGPIGTIVPVGCIKCKQAVGHGGGERGEGGGAK